MANTWRWSLGCWCVLLAAPLSQAAESKAPSDSTSRDVQALAAKIDQLIAARWAAEKVQPAPLADDAEFMRRIYLDLAGRIPSLTEARTFLDDKTPDKRRRLIDRLLDSPDYVNHFTHVWRALLLPEADTNNFEVQALVPGFEAWLRKHLADNTHHDKMVREIITMGFGSNRMPALLRAQQRPAEASPIAFYLAKDVKPENLAASTARVFLGVRLECAQCHNHPYARWTREQFWGYAAFFAGLQRRNQQDGEGGPIREVLDRSELQIPGGSQFIRAIFLDSTEPAQWQFKAGARGTLAKWMTSADNPYFARAAVNRMWGYFFGTGLVEPVDDLEGRNQPSHPELLDELGRQFAAHDFDWKFLIRALTSTRAYQLTSLVTHPSQDDPRRFGRMAVKGLTAEQIFDSIIQATGYRERVPNNQAPGAPLNQSPLRAEFLARFANNQGEKPTEAQTSILQALALMNGKFSADITSFKGKGTLATVAGDPSLKTAQRIETLFLAALSRKPTAKETERLVEYVDRGGPDNDAKKALADVFWALLNSGEFILNH